MRKSGTLLSILFAALAVFAALPGAAEEKQASRFELARTESAKLKKPMMIVFTDTARCPWCVKLEKEVLSQNAFKKYAADHLVLYIADFGNRKVPAAERARESELFDHYKLEGVPSVVLLAPDGKTIGTTGYQRGGAAKYVEHLQKMIAAHK